MLFNPILPIWLMGIICVLLLFLKRKGVWPFIRQILIVILLFVINLRCMLPGDTVEINEQSLDTYVLFVVDDTISMVAQDYDGSRERLEGVRQDCAYIIDALQGAHFSVLSFHNTANQLTPYTDNAEHVKNVIDAIYPIEEIYANGTSMNVVKDPMIKILTEAATKTDGKLAVFFISDGEITSETDELQSFKEVAPFVGNGAVLGYGTDEGGQMQLKSRYDFETETIMDYDVYPVVPALSKIDEKNLKQIADDLSLPYIHMTDTNELDGIIQKIKSEATLVRENRLVTKTTDPYLGAKDLYYVFVSPLLILLVAEAICMVKKKAYGG